MAVWPNGSTTIPQVTSNFGPRPAPIAGASTMHKGIDLVGWRIVKAPWAGRVVLARYNGGAGNEVRIQSSNGDTAKLFHNAAFYVTEGQTVAEGQDVALMGTTGTSTGVHCHFETWGGGGQSVIDPKIYMAMAIANTQPATVPTPTPAKPTTLGEEDMKIICATDEGTYGGFSAKSGNWALVTGAGFIDAKTEEDLHAWANLLGKSYEEVVAPDSTVTSRMTGRSFAILASQFKAEQAEFAQVISSETLK